ncbi:MAG: hypothetical protein ABI808_07720 [Pseudonocardiales bacterium]
MTPKTDPMELLAGFRPTAAQLEHEWPADQRAVMREGIRTNTVPTGTVTRFQRPPTRGHHKQWSAIAGLVGAAAAALLAVQIMQPAGNPGPRTGTGTTHTATGHLAALGKLALAAQATSARALHPGEFRHLITTQSDRRVLESWTSYDGDVWRHDDNAGAAATADYLMFPRTGDSFASASPRYLAGLPSDADNLQSYLLSHVCGSSSRDEAVFVGVGDMLRGDYAPTALRVAAIHVLERTGHITTHQSQDAQGHPALQVDFIDHSIRPGETQSLFFDPNTSALLQEQIKGGGMDFTATYSASSTATGVPADVLAKAVRQEDHADPVPSVTPTCTWDK